MRGTLRSFWSISLLLSLSLCPCLYTMALGRTADRIAAEAWYQDRYSDAELDELFGSIALYSDPLLAQVIPAATYVDQVLDAQRVLRGSTDDNLIDSQNWDISVKAIAHYPRVLKMLADQPDWTTAIGQAYVNQPTDVTRSIQRLRAAARANGALVSNAQQRVYLEDGAVLIVPAQPRVIYVPEYNPDVVYVRRGPSTGTIVAASLIAFGAGLALGAWLNRDYNWHGRGIYYHGWSGIGWIRASRPYVNVQNRYYVNNNYRTVVVNRTIVNRNITTYRTNVHTRAINNNRNINVGRSTRTYTPATGVNSHRTVDRSTNNVPNRTGQPTRSTDVRTNRINGGSTQTRTSGTNHSSTGRSTVNRSSSSGSQPKSHTSSGRSSSPAPRRSSSGGSSKPSGKSSGSGKSKGH